MTMYLLLNGSNAKNGLSLSKLCEDLDIVKYFLENISLVDEKTKNTSCIQVH